MTEGPLRTFWLVLGNDVRQLLRQSVFVFILFSAPLLLCLGGLLSSASLRDLGEGEKTNANGERETYVIAADATFASWIEPEDALTVEPGASVPESGDPGDGDALARVEVHGNEVTIAYRLDVDASDRAQKRIRKVVWRVRRNARNTALEETGVDASYRNLLVIENQTPTGGTAEPPNFRVAQLSGLLVVTIFLLSLTVGMDIVTGEKERKTIESLLVTPIDRTQMVLAKTTLTLLYGGLGGWIGLGGVVAAGAAGLLDDPLSGPAALGLAAIVVLWTLQIAPMVLLVAAVAPDYRTGSLLAGPMVLVAMGLTSVAMIPGVELGPLTALVPLGNLTLVGRDAAAGSLSLGFAILAFAASAASVGVSLFGVVRRMDREAAFLPKGSSPRPSRIGEVTAITIAAVVLMLFFGQAAQTLDLVWGMVFTQVGLLGGLALGSAGFLGIPIAATFSLRRPTLRDTGLALLVAVGLPAVAGLVFQLQEPFLPIPSALVEVMSQITLEDQPLWVPLIVFALLPGVFEELLFRGLLLGLLTRGGRLGVTARVVVVALAFGVLHIFWPRILPTAAVGAVLGFVVVRSGSLWLAMGIHAVYNGLLLTIARQATDATVEPLPWWGLLLGTGFTVAAVAGMSGHSPRDASA